jgi:hypothetical protein
VVLAADGIVGGLGIQAMEEYFAVLVKDLLQPGSEPLEESHP